MFNITPINVTANVLSGHELTSLQQASHALTETVLAATTLPGLSPTSVKLVADMLTQVNHLTSRGTESTNNTTGADNTTSKNLQNFISRDHSNSLEF